MFTTNSAQNALIVNKTYQEVDSRWERGEWLWLLHGKTNLLPLEVYDYSSKLIGEIS